MTQPALINPAEKLECLDAQHAQEFTPRIELLRRELSRLQVDATPLLRARQAALKELQEAVRADVKLLLGTAQLREITQSLRTNPFISFDMGTLPNDPSQWLLGALPPSITCPDFHLRGSQYETSLALLLDHGGQSTTLSGSGYLGTDEDDLSEGVIDDARDVASEVLDWLENNEEDGIEGWLKQQPQEARLLLETSETLSLEDVVHNALSVELTVLWVACFRVQTASIWPIEI